MVLLIDSNVILDYMLKRQPFYDAAKKILDVVDGRANLTGYISAAAVTDIYYIAYRQLKNRERVQELLEEVWTFVEVFRVSDKEIRKALDLHWKDFEDAVQYRGGTEWF